MCKEFNVIKEPCIPVRMITGEFTTLSIRDVFDKAVDIKGIYCQSPFEEYGLKRMLAVFVMDCFNFETDDDLLNTYKSGYFDMKVFDAYISKCEEKGDVFNLFSKDFPFFQTKLDENIDNIKKVGFIDSLFYDLPSNTNHTFSQRIYDGFSPIHCLWGLTALSPFLYGMGGEGYCGGVNGDSPYYYWIIGKNLFHELILNSISKEVWSIESGVGTEDRHIVEYGGEPIWRRSTSIKVKEPFYDIKLFEALTFMGRRVTLMDVKDNGNVYSVCIGPASKYIYEERDKKNASKVIYRSSWRDPYCAYEELGSKASIIAPHENEIYWINNNVFYDVSANKAPLILNKLGINGMASSYTRRKLKKWDLEELNLISYGGYNPKKQGLYKWWSRNDISVEVDITENKELSSYFYTAYSYVPMVANEIKSRLIDKKVSKTQIINRMNKTEFYSDSYNYIHTEFKNRLLNSSEYDIELILEDLKRELLKYAIKCYENNLSLNKVIRSILDQNVSKCNNNQVSIYYLDLKRLRLNICKILDIKIGGAREDE